MNVSDPSWITGYVTSSILRRKKRNAYGKDAGYVCDRIVAEFAVFRFITLVTEQKKPETPQDANENIAHTGVIIIADGRLKPWFFTKQISA